MIALLSCRRSVHRDKHVVLMKRRSHKRITVKKTLRRLEAKHAGKIGLSLLKARDFPVFSMSSREPGNVSRGLEGKKKIAQGQTAARCPRGSNAMRNRPVAEIMATEKPAPA